MPLAERGVPIVSVINLKGGVGKTTITANLAAALAAGARRVLVIDLDYQRSLSLLCCSPRQIMQLHQSGRCLQHFLLDGTPDAGRLLRCVAAVKAAKALFRRRRRRGADRLGPGGQSRRRRDAPVGRMAPGAVRGRHPLPPAPRPARPGRADLFDYVLLDCPPRLSTACVNALAASDFALIPVLLDTTSAQSVPNLLRKLRRLRGGVLAQLGVLGVVANRVKLIGGALKNAEAAVWDEMRRPCVEAWEGPVHFFATAIKESSAVAEAAQRQADGKATFTFAAHRGELQPVFAELADQVRGRIDHDSRRLAAVPS